MNANERLQCFRAWPAAAIVAMCVCGLWGCGAGHAAPAPRDVVYFCTETHEAFVGSPRPVPALNPKTGHRTLMPALYNSATSKWQAMPPMKDLEGNPGAAVNHNSNARLSPEGPREGLQKLPAVKK